MDQSTHVHERRRHPRYYPDRKNQPKVSFNFNSHDKIPVDVINISQGGLLGCASNGNQFSIQNNRKVNQIKIKFPCKQPFCCSGKVLRVQPSREIHKYFCAVQFDEFGTDSNKSTINIGDKIDRSLRPTDEIFIPDQIFINRLEKAENYLKNENPHFKSHPRKTVYDSFDDITSNLSLEEKYWFFRIVDEMKQHKPEYPEKLKTAFLTLCRIGMEQTMRNAHKADDEG